MSSLAQKTMSVFELLTEREQTLVFELIQSLAPDDVAMPEDIAAHATAMDEYHRGETFTDGDINWN